MRRAGSTNPDTLRRVATAALLAASTLLLELGGPVMASAAPYIRPPGGQYQVYVPQPRPNPATLIGTGDMSFNQNGNPVWSGPFWNQAGKRYDIHTIELTLKARCGDHDNYETQAGQRFELWPQYSGDGYFTGYSVKLLDRNGTPLGSQIWNK